MTLSSHKDNHTYALDSHDLKRRGKGRQCTAPVASRPCFPFWIHALNLTPNIFFPNALAFFMLFLDPNSTQTDTRFGFIQKIKVKNVFFLPGTYTARPEGISTLTLYHLGLGISNTIASPKTLGLIIYIYIFPSQYEKIRTSEFRLTCRSIVYLFVNH